MLATISLTIPLVLLVGFATARGSCWASTPSDMILLVLTLGLSMLTFASARTNVLPGAVHLLLFLAYLMLLFDR